MIKNRVKVSVIIESGCKISEGEYRIELIQFIGSLDIDRDIKLIKNCIEENLPCDADEVSDDDDEYCINYELVKSNDATEVFYEIVQKEVIGW